MKNPRDMTTAERIEAFKAARARLVRAAEEMVAIWEPRDDAFDDFACTDYPTGIASFDDFACQLAHWHGSGTLEAGRALAARPVNPPPNLRSVEHDGKTYYADDGTLYNAPDEHGEVTAICPLAMAPAEIRTAFGES